MIYSKTVKERFSRAATDYEGRADFQQEVAEELLALIHRITPIDVKSGPIKILDMGCGTGRLMRELAKGSEFNLFGLDIALPMLFEAAGTLGDTGGNRGMTGVEQGEIGGKTRWGLVNGACEAIPFVSGHFDLVISNLAYQWISSLSAAFSDVRRVLLPGGTFVFSTLGPATLNELVSSLSEAESETGGGRFNFTPFTSEADIKSALGDGGLQLIDIDKKIIMRSYDNPLHLLKTLKQTGASARGEIMERNLSMGTFLRRVMRIYEQRFSAADGSIPATYEVLYIIAEKKL